MRMGSRLVLMVASVAAIGLFTLMSAPSKETLQKMAQKQNWSSMTNYGRANATFVTLARNNDLYDLLESIRSVEDRFNGKYNYDWVFLNNEEFSEEFTTLVSRLVSGQARFGQIKHEHWSYPDYIDQEKAAQCRKAMSEKGIIYGDNEAYRHMCRYESGFFFQEDIMKEYKYYWRVEPETHLHCDIDYDVFKFMEDNGKKYGWTISITEWEETIKTLWATTKQFVDKYPETLSKNALSEFLSDDGLETYNLCHFWSNFEVADMDFWRGDVYQAYFNHLDQSGGFFYERWGDAPVHSIAAGLFLDKDELHFFDDIGYTHPPFMHCPVQQVERNLKCSCAPVKSFDWHESSCLRNYYNAQGVKFQEERFVL